MRQCILFFLLLVFARAHALDMTLEEKIGQILMVHFHGEVANEDARRLCQDLHVGGFIYFNWANGLNSPEQVARLSAELQKLARTPLLIATDQEGGRVVRLRNGFPVFPSSQAIAQTGDPELAEFAAYVTGLSLRSVGINMNLAPVVDVNSNPDNPVINTRSFGMTPEVVISFSDAALQGYHKAGIATCLKHFPGHGDVNVDSHCALPRVDKSLEQLEQMELRPFRLLSPYADAIMTAHIQVPSLDREDTCATVSKSTLDYLRNDIEFNGLIISDALVMKGVLSVCSSVEEAAIRAIGAGCDMLILGGRQLTGQGARQELTVDDIARIHHALFQAVKSNRIPEERIDRALERILELKDRFTGRPFPPCICCSFPSLQIAKEDLHSIGQKIWQNECNGSMEGLTHWNSGEDFGSFGIGHFIWYPQGKLGPFRETFPDLLVFLKSEGVQLPGWLEQAQGCPWKNQERFLKAKESVEMQELRRLLFETQDLQVAFIANRLKQALPLMLETVPNERHLSIRHSFYKLAKDPQGLYALIDYVNFKGEGSSVKESYNGSGWGLLQVLQRMPEDSISPVNDFAKAAKLVLVQRVENSPPERRESSWLQGWLNRIDSYLLLLTAPSGIEAGVDF